LAGAEIDTSNGGAKYSASFEMAIFTVKFTVKNDAPLDSFDLSVTQTELLNPDAGWGIDSDQDGTKDTPEPVPVLVGALDNGDPNFGGADLTDDFPVLAVDTSGPLATLQLTATPCPDADLDGLCDSVETNTGIYIDPTDTGTDPNNDDTDGDGLKDGEEVNTFNTNPTERDSDADGYPDGSDPNPLVQDPPGGEGYEPSLDTRTYSISGSALYSGSTSGTLYVKVYADAGMISETGSVSVADPVFPQEYEISGLEAKSNYYLLAFLDVAGGQSGVADLEEPKGILELDVATDMSGSDVTLIDGPFQAVYTSPAIIRRAAGSSFSFDVYYDTSDNNETLTGLGLRIHYDSSKLTWNEFSDVLSTAKTAEDLVPADDTMDYDNDPSTDKYLGIAWFDPSENWPGATLPVKLYAVSFTAAEGLDENDVTLIRISASDNAVSYSLFSTPAVFQVKSFNCDIDGNGQARALSDGILIARYMFGFRGNTLISGAVAPDATRTSAAEIEAFIADGVATDLLDVDANGEARALSDGILIARYMFGFGGNTLISGAVAPDATRTSAAEIEAYLLQMMP
jgi:hypothetical protein